jgi:predicted dehydrogenase
MKALIVGLGSIGRRHLDNLRQVVPEVEIVVLRRSGGGSSNTPGIVVHSMQDALAQRPDIAIVASPAAFHLTDSLALAQAGVHLLVEKPISHSIDGVAELIATCRAKSLVLAVGYHLRHSPALHTLRAAVAGGTIGRVLAIRSEVGQWLPDWRPNSDYREGASARSSLGGGVVLELSHEFDYLRWLFGEVDRVIGVADRLSALEIDVEDTAESILRFRSGALASVHLDMIQRNPVRHCRIVGSQGTLSWDGLTHQVVHLVAGSTSGVELHPANAFERNQMFLTEIEDFLCCIRTGSQPRCGGEDGLRALEIALAIKSSSASGLPIQLTNPY